MVRTLIEELHRRKVLRVAAAYVLAGWLLLQVVDVVSEPLGWPLWVSTVLIYAAVALFPVVLAISWFYDLTALGFVRDPGPQSPAVSPTFIKLDDPSRRRLAVLPFVMLGGDDDDAFLADGIGEEILNALAPHEEIDVIARTSSFRFRDADVDTPRIRAELGATHIITGSVRRAGAQLRIAVQLVETAHERQLWSESFHRSSDDVFWLQRDIASSVDKALVTILGLKQYTAESRWKLSPGAYELFLRARAAFWRGDFPKTLQLADASAKVDPENPLVPTLVAEVFLYWPRYGFATGAEELRRAEVAAGEALAIDADYAPAQAAKGMLALYLQRDFRGAFETVAAAAVQQPGVAEWLPILLTYANRHADGCEVQRRIAQRDPLNAFNLLTWANRLNWIGRTDQAKAAVERAREIDPTHLILSNLAFRWKLRAGDIEGAKAMLRSWGLDPDHPMKKPSHDWLPLSLAYWLGSRLYGEMGDTDTARRLAARIEEEAGFTATTVAEAYINAGAVDDAYRLWDMAIARIEPGAYDLAMPQDMRDPENGFWLRFREDRRFDEQLVKLGIHAAAFEGIDWAIVDRVKA